MGTEDHTQRVDDPPQRPGETPPGGFGVEGVSLSWYQRLARLLVEPWPRLSSPDAFRARVVASLVLANLLTSVVATVAVIIFWSGRAPGLGWLFGPIGVANVGLYLLARTRHYRWPGLFLVLWVPAGVIPAVYMIPDPATFAIAMCWLIIGVGISSFLLPGWASLVVLALNLMIPLVMVRLTGQEPAMLVGLELFIFTGSAVILFHNWVIRRSERAAETHRWERRVQDRARQEVEAVLTSREEQLRITLDSIGDAVIATDPDGRVVELNPTATALLGVSSPEALGMPVEKVLRLLDPDSGAPTTLDELQGDGSGPVDAVVQQGEGEVTRRVEITRSPLRDAAGAHLGEILALRDQTERFALQEQLQQAQRLEAVGRLAGGVAHDFNNLLFSISSLTELMEMSADESFPFHQELQDILEAVDRGSTLTAQLLAFSSRQVLRMELLDLGAVAGELAKMLRRVIGEDIELRYRTTDGLGLVQADRSQVEQILLNLALNGREAMPDGGKLTVETANLILDAGDVEQTPELAVGHYVLLAVSDTGTGMSEEVRESIFEPFFTTKDRGKGSGLGLSMVYGLVQQHGGHIQVHSAADQGTVFKVYLPVVEPEAAAGDGPDDQAAERPLLGSGETILLAEDEEMPRQLTARALNQLGYRVITANDGAHALEVAREHVGPIHLLLSDVLMPRLTGPELYRELIQERPQLRVVYLSGYTGSTIVDHGMLAEGVQFLQKPVSVRKLARKVHQVLGMSSPDPDPDPDSPDSASP